MEREELKKLLPGLPVELARAVQLMEKLVAQTSGPWRMDGETLLERLRQGSSDGILEWLRRVDGPPYRTPGLPARPPL